MFISFLYMFRATMCPSSGEITVLCDTWYLSLCVDDYLVCKVHTSHPHRVTNTKCCTDTVISWYLSLCVDDCLVCWVHTRQSSTQSDKYQVSHRYGYFSWWWAHGRPKHVQKRNKQTKKNCAPSWLYLQDYTRMHGQQNIKNYPVSCFGSCLYRGNFYSRQRESKS
jgi:hypothetical protein